MGYRSVFLQSLNGSRIRSPLGVFKANVFKTLEIFTAPPLIFDTETYTVTGENFGATQGIGLIYLSESPVVDVGAVSQAVTSWSDTTIVFTADSSAFDSMMSILYIIVVSDAGQFDNEASSSLAITATSDRNEYDFTGGGQRGGAYICGAASANYCSIRLSGFVDALELSGYSNSLTNNPAGIRFDFFNDSPGFCLVGATSGKTVNFPARASFYDSNIFTGYSTWCDAEGLFTVGGLHKQDGSYGTENNLWIAYASGSCGASYYGWTANEDIYIVPKYPVSVQIVSGTGKSYKVGTNITLVASAFDGSGDISSSVQWWDVAGEAFVYTGSTYYIPSASAGSYGFSLKVVSSFGQTRLSFQAEGILVADMAISSLFGSGGDDSGGAQVIIFGNSFSPAATVEFDGVSATSVNVLSTDQIECIAPAGVGAVDVVVIDGAYDATIAGGFTYQAINNVTVASASPNTASAAGGDTITITGAGFTADCEVTFISITDAGAIITGTLGFTFISATEITIETDESEVGLFWVAVADTVTGAAGYIKNEFTFT